MHQIKEWLKLMFFYPTLRLESIDYDEYWRSKRGRSMGALSDWQLERADFIVATLKGESGMSLSDIGCGEGAILHYVGSKLGASHLLGADLSDAALSRTREFGIEALKLDISKREEYSKIAKADYQILFEILEHIPNSEELLTAAYDKADKGVFFSFPNTGFFAHRFRLFFGKFPLQWRLFPGEHVRFWTKADLLWWLNSLGFTDYSVHYYKGVPIVNKLLPSFFAAGMIVFLDKNREI